jgi:hypothetical protein
MRTLLVIGAGTWAVYLATTPLRGDELPKVVWRVETDAKLAQLPFLSWDTEGGNRTQTNLLRTPVKIRLRGAERWIGSEELPVRRESLANGGTRFHLDLSQVHSSYTDGLVWDIIPGPDCLVMTLSSKQRMPEVEMVFPFEMRAALTTALASRWALDGTFRLPAVVSAPDFGQMLLSCQSEEPKDPWSVGYDDRDTQVKGRLEGNRGRVTMDLILSWPRFLGGARYTLDFRPVRLPAPKGLVDTSLWPSARRGWFNTFQPSATQCSTEHDGDTTPGILANNVISDRVISAMFRWSDAALLVPDAAPGVSFSYQVRRTLDWLLEERVRPDGETIGYEGRPMLDANAASLIAAWDYVEATGDKTWLAFQIEKLELMADFMAKRDVDGDGLIELKNSGNYGEKTGYNSAWDCYNEGHKDGYINMLAYRAWRCLADLEAKLGRTAQQQRYQQLGDRLKAVFAKTLHNPATGWLAYWKSADGQLHDYAWPSITGTAIVYGLVEPAEGREMLGRLWKKVEEIGFKSFDLGLPCTLVPVHRGDYIGKAVFDAMGEDGKGQFGKYLNGGCLVSDTMEFILANYIVGERERADLILRAMLKRQEQGGFQNGYGNGGEFLTWEGKPCGYEGHLTYSWSFLQAVLLREPQFRERLYRPLAGKAFDKR